MATTFTFLDAVNRVMRANGIIRGDTDEVSTFSDLQHGATVQLARLAIQDELVELVSDTLIPSERDTTGSISAVAGARSYALPSDFIRFDGTAMLLRSDNNNQLFEYPGGEDALKLIYNEYLTQQSTPSYWYFDRTSSKKIAFFPVPDEAATYTFDYESDSSVDVAADILPFHNDIECHAFCRLASRRFKMLYEEMDPALIANDPEHQKAKATLASLIVGKNPSRRWAPVYR